MTREHREAAEAVVTENVAAWIRLGEAGIADRIPVMIDPASGRTAVGRLSAPRTSTPSWAPHEHPALRLDRHALASSSAANAPPRPTRRPSRCSATPVGEPASASPTASSPGSTPRPTPPSPPRWTAWRHEPRPRVAPGRAVHRRGPVPAEARRGRSAPGLRRRGAGCSSPPPAAPTPAGPAPWRRLCRRSSPRPPASARSPTSRWSTRSSSGSSASRSPTTPKARPVCRCSAARDRPDGSLAFVWSPEGLNDTLGVEGPCCCCGGNEVRAAEELLVNLLAIGLDAEAAEED